MKIPQLCLVLLIFASVLAYPMVFVSPVIAQQAPADINLSPRYQITPTTTPLMLLEEEIFTTDPILLQIIIIFGILAVLVIFIGVWISQQQADIK